MKTSRNWMLLSSLFFVILLAAVIPLPVAQADSCCVDCLQDGHCDDGDECTRDICNGEHSCDHEPIDDCPPDEPGKDHPDDNSDVGASAALPPGAIGGGETRAGDPRVGVLRSGYHADSEALLEDFGEAWESVNPSFDPAIVSRLPVLLIPSAGLVGMAESSQMKARLAEYVSLGGFVIALAQQHGADYEALPGGIKAVGWVQDQSCVAASVGMERFHQVLSSLNETFPDINEDGYITDWPDGSQILFRRSKNSQPALVLYPYGEGQVLVSGQFSDWAFTHALSTSQEVALLRDAVAWGKEATELPQIRPAESVEIEVELGAAATAPMVEITIYDPDRTPWSSQTLIPGEPGPLARAMVTFDASPDAVLGIWSVTVRPLTDLGQADGEEIVGARFSVADPPEATTLEEEQTFSVLSDATDYAFGSDGRFEINVYNNTEAPTTVTCWSSFPHHYWATDDTIYGHPGSSRPINVSNLVASWDVPAGDSASFFYTVPVVYSYDRLWVQCRNGQGSYIGRQSKGFYGHGATAELSAHLNRDDGVYLPTDSLAVNLALSNAGVVPIEGDLEIEAFAPNGDGFFETEWPFSLPVGGAVTLDRDLEIGLPDDAEGGLYHVVITARSSGQVIARKYLDFELLTSGARVSSRFNSDGPLAAVAHVEALSLSPVAIVAGSLEVVLTSPAGVQAQGDAEVDLFELGASTQVDVPLNLGQAELGEWVLSWSLDGAGSTGEGAQILTSALGVDVKLDRTEYGALDTVVVAADVHNLGDFDHDLTVTVSIEGFDEIWPLEVPVDTEALGTVSWSLPVPDDIAPGIYEGVVTASPSAGIGEATQSFQIVVPAYRIEGDLPTGPVAAGNSLSFPLRNYGGQVAPLFCYVSMADATDVDIASDDLAVDLAPGETALELSVPGQARAGTGSPSGISDVVSVKQPSHRTVAVCEGWGRSQSWCCQRRRVQGPARLRPFDRIGGVLGT